MLRGKGEQLQDREIVERKVGLENDIMDIGQPGNWLNEIWHKNGMTEWWHDGMMEWWHDGMMKWWNDLGHSTYAIRHRT